jgi:hypothetical protein
MRHLERYADSQLPLTVTMAVIYGFPSLYLVTVFLACGAFAKPPHVIFALIDE